MRVMIPYINSAWGGTELRYAVRSLSYLGDIELWVVGQCPEWLKPDVFIPCSDNPNPWYKENNIKEKIILAVKEGIADNGEFLFTNDDIFLLRETSVIYPYYQNGNLVMGRGQGNYQKSIANTITALKRLGKGVLNFDIHVPIRYDKDFPDIMQEVDWRIPNGYIIKSLYSNFKGIEGEYHSDLKISAQQPSYRLRTNIYGQDVFSIGDRSMGLPMKTLLQQLYPTPSKYETSI